MTSVTLPDHLIVALVVLLVPAGQLTAMPMGFFGGRQKIGFYWSNSIALALLAGAVLASWRLAGRSWHALGLTAAPVRYRWGALLTLLFLIAFAADAWWRLGSPARLAATRRLCLRHMPFLPQTGEELRHSLVLAATAAVTEEILYRGFLIAYAAHFTGTSPAGLAAAVALAALVSGGSHLYLGPWEAFRVLLVTGLFGAVVVVTQSLWIAIALHFFRDVTGMLLGPKLLGPED